MSWQGALVREQGVTFGIVLVNPHVAQSTFAAQRVINGGGATLFPGVPVVVMALDSQGIPTFRGRPDIVNFLVNVPVHAIPWRQYTIS